MDATIKVLENNIRIYTNRKIWRPSQVPVTAAGEEVEVMGEWAAGMGDGPGKFSVEAKQDGNLRRWLEELDPYGKPVQSTDSASVAMEAGEVLEFTTHNSNAFTVSSETAAPAEPEEEVC